MFRSVDFDCTERPTFISRNKKFIGTRSIFTDWDGECTISNSVGVSRGKGWRSGRHCSQPSCVSTNLPTIGPKYGCPFASL